MKDIKKKKIFKHIIIFLSILIILDFLYTFINNYLYPYNFTEKNIFYGLTYKKNIDKHHFFNLYGKTRYCADINGFRTKCNKKNEEEYDIIFIGNIFTEGMDLIYEDTFVGQISDKLSNLKIANLGMRTYSSKNYFNKIKFLLDNQIINFNEVIVYFDISNIKKADLNSDIKTKRSFDFRYSVRNFFRKNFTYFYKIYLQTLYTIIPKHIWAYSPTNHKSSWTNKSYNKNNDKILNINNEFKYMDKLYKMLKKKNIRLSIGIYPWPYQILYDKKNSEYVEIIKKFCKKKCSNLFNTFPEFFDAKNRFGKWKTIEKYYMKYSVHLNKNGSKILSDNFISNYKK